MNLFVDQVYIYTFPIVCTRIIDQFLKQSKPYLISSRAFTVFWRLYFIESMLKLFKCMTDVAINHIYVVIKIFLENYLQALSVHVSVNINRTNSVLIENHTHKLITYTTFWLTSCTCTCQQKNKNSDFIENHYYMYY